MKSTKKVWCNGQLVEVSDEVKKAFTKGYRKEKYYSEDLKTDHYKINQEKATVKYIPSREDSYERLMEENQMQFADDSETVEEIAVRNVLIERLRNNLILLKDDESLLIKQHFYEGITETDLAETYGISQQAISKRIKKILKKLKFLLEN